VKKLTLFIALACCAATAFSSRAQAPDINHTVVRFDIFAGGTNFGKIDIELFDQEKPETVKNFLLYVYSGAYSNLVLHRLVPNFVLQAGHIHIEDPTSTNAFSSYPALTDFGRITNEYAVGPTYTNDFGTIAMARVGGQTNSATTDWYINLTNNPFLNTTDGGFTVFGRVVNTMDDRSGTNLLLYLNTLSNGNGIRSVFVADPGESLSDLPVTTNRATPAVYADLFTVQTSFVQGGLPRDTIAPTVQVTQPANASITTTSSSLTISGTAADNQEVARVLYDTAAGKSLVMNGKTSWSLEFPLDYGTNRFSVRSVDSFGNVSPVIERVIVREERPPASNHTVVRFDIFNNGTNFGRLDVELYDQEKPETVKNFLLYVYSGGYSNLVLHTLRPNEVLQAGHVRADDPSGFSLSTYTHNHDFGTITNEYDIGPQPNEFGTIATARIPGVANSASNEWHINLANNPLYNTSHGGSTVFGRVVNTVNERSGINLLRYFNTFQDQSNIRPVSIQGDQFQVPVTAYHLQTFPITSEMFLVRASFLQGGVARDSISPFVQINDPTSTSVIVTTNSTVNFSGTAADNQAVARVIYDTPAGVAFPVNGRENWSKEVALIPGTNRVTVRAVDYFGNVGTDQRTIFLSHPRSVRFEPIGKGKVIGITNGQTFLVGVHYKFIAIAGARQYFLGWRANDGNIFSADRVLEFTMPEELTNLVAVFSRTFLGLTNGTYQGLFFPSSNGPPRSSGAISFNLGANGRYSGRLAPVGANYLISGGFDLSGYSAITGTLGVDTLVLRLYLYPDETISGDYQDGHFYSSVGLGHVKNFTNSAPQAGKFSFLISPIASVTGYGFGSATIDTRGKIKMTATLADGTAIKQTSALLAGDAWPFYASAKAGRKVTLGYAFFDTNNVFHADLRWFDRSFPGNTNQVAQLDGSPYVPPSQGRLFRWTNGVMSLSGGGLQAAIFANLQLNDNGSFTFPSNPNNIQLGIPDANGLITGSFTHPVTSALTSFRGAVLQSSNMAAGFFLNGATSGAFVIRGN
jgi:cyclophilin family peptidyl-prolyl cis-trans isomerase